MKNLILLATALAIGGALLTGCSHKDSTDTAAPPPSQNAVPEPAANKTQPTNAPMRGPGAAPAGGAQQPLGPPPGQ